MKKVVVVSGGNRGIGLEIVKGLLSQHASEFHVVFTSRDVTKGEAVLQKVKEDAPPGADVDLMQLEVGNDESMQTFVSQVKDKFGKVQVMINNAGIMFGNSSKLSFEEQTEPTLRTNYFGTVALTEAMLPLIGPEGRIINIASQLGTSTFNQCTPALQARWKDDNLTTEGVNKMVQEYWDGVKSGTLSENGWASNNYGTSKLGLISYTKALAKREPSILSVSMCPGWCRTDMGTQMATKSAEEGADTAIFLATAKKEELVAGHFYSNRRDASFL